MQVKCNQRREAQQLYRYNQAINCLEMLLCNPSCIFYECRSDRRGNDIDMFSSLLRCLFRIAREIRSRKVDYANDSGLCTMFTSKSSTQVETTSVESDTTSVLDESTTEIDTTVTPIFPVCLSINNTGSLLDGQLRYNFGSGAYPVTFRLYNGYMNVSLPKQTHCYVSRDSQLQCDDIPQTSDDYQFSIIDGELAYAGNTTLWLCDAGTGGSNIYTTQYYKEIDACHPVHLHITIIPCVDPPVVNSVQILAPSKLQVTGSNFGAYATDLRALIIYAHYVTANCTDLQLYNDTFLTCQLDTGAQRKRSQPPYLTIMVNFLIFAFCIFAIIYHHVPIDIFKLNHTEKYSFQRCV